MIIPFSSSSFSHFISSTFQFLSFEDRHQKKKIPLNFNVCNRHHTSLCLSVCLPPSLPAPTAVLLPTYSLAISDSRRIPILFHKSLQFEKRGEERNLNLF